MVISSLPPRSAAAMLVAAGLFLVLAGVWNDLAGATLTAIVIAVQIVPRRGADFHLGLTCVCFALE